jgi:hypothetical protein
MDNFMKTKSLFLSLMAGLAAVGAHAENFSTDFTAQKTAGDLTTVDTNWVAAWDVQLTQPALQGWWTVYSKAPNNELQVDLDTFGGSGHTKAHSVVYYATGQNSNAQTSTMQMSTAMLGTSPGNQGGPAVGIKTYVVDGVKYVEWYALLIQSNQWSIVKSVGNLSTASTKDTVLYTSGTFTPAANDIYSISQTYAHGAYTFSVTITQGGTPTAYGSIATDINSNQNGKPGMHYLYATGGGGCVVKNWSGEQS